MNCTKTIDLRGTPCPLNFIKCRLAIEKLNSSDSLSIELDVGEPEAMVISGLINDGHQVEVTYKNEEWLRLMVITGAT